jgi:hypothetical protein
LLPQDPKQLWEGISYLRRFEFPYNENNLNF